MKRCVIAKDAGVAVVADPADLQGSSSSHQGSRDSASPSDLQMESSR